MFGFRWHKWYIINEYNDDIIKDMANNFIIHKPYDPNLANTIYGSPIYEEKICTKCKKYVDEITPRYEYWLKKLKIEATEQEKIHSMIAKVKGKEKRIWERVKGNEKRVRER